MATPPGQAVRPGGRSGLANDAITPLALGGVEAVVGALDQRLRGVVGTQQREADGNRHAAEPLAARSFHQFLGHDRAADVVGDGDRQAQGRLWQRDDEFLAAVTGCDVMTTFCFIETARDPAHLIAGEMAEPLYGCVMKTRERRAVREIKADPSKSPCRRRLQTAMSCFAQKPRW